MSENGKLFITLSNSLNLNCTTPNLNQANGDYFNLGANNIFSGKESLGNCSEFPFPSKVNDNDANAVSKHFKTCWNLVFATNLLRSLRISFPERDTDSTIFVWQYNIINFLRKDWHNNEKFGINIKKKEFWGYSCFVFVSKNLSQKIALVIVLSSSPEIYQNLLHIINPKHWLLKK